jgi:hypothetical protein
MEYRFLGRSGMIDARVVQAGNSVRGGDINALITRSCSGASLMRLLAVINSNVTSMPFNVSDAVICMQV